MSINQKPTTTTTNAKKKSSSSSNNIMVHQVAPILQSEMAPKLKFAITSIDVQATTDGYVKFDGSIKGKADDVDAVFLTHVEHIGDRKTGFWPMRKEYNVYRGQQVSVDKFVQEVQEEANRLGKSGVLLYVHGFSSEPKFGMSRVDEYYQEGGNALCIPVFWPTEGRVTGYLDDKATIVPGASGGLSTLVNKFKELREKVNDQQELKLCLMCHSMGNFLLRNISELYEGFPLFDNIFMVAADVSSDIFDADAVTNALDAKHPGLSIANLVKESGKIHVLWAKRDTALLGRLFMNWFEAALGRTGVRRETLHKKLVGEDPKKDKIVTYNCDEFSSSFGFGHNYQFAPQLVQYYDECMLQ